MSPAITRKRFIAGGLPGVQRTGQDPDVEEDGVPHRECVACGYADTLNAQGQSIPKELGTRVNQNAPKPANPKVQSVQFFPNPKLKKKPDA